ncbi:putative transcriptional regulator AbrB family [Candidatus Termititenax aidoneus]|uniref:Transcriptional regulator AbrB family n=1 Tax=Termititenax aidoneus TaxID=2218524 RepID=A0A388T9I6_TERA1|nr:putative transcriptional regulator AbrB family [Candidatus Termititenax aidoneus]
MSTVTLSSKYQVVIPKEVRKDAGLQAGAILEVLVYGQRIELVPLQPLSNLKGIFKGLNTEILREKERL